MCVKPQVTRGLQHAAAAHLTLERLLAKWPRREEGAGEETDG